MRVVFFTADQGGCGFYRSLMPAVWMNRLGLAEAYYSYSFAYMGEQVMDYDSFYSGSLLQKARESVAIPKTTADVLSNLESADICVYQRQSNTLALGHMRAMKKAGKIVFVEHDDWLMGRATSPIVRKVFSDPQRQLVLETMAREADGIIVSTQGLADLISPLNPSIHICPNSIDTDIWKWSDMRAPASVGYAGSPCHNDDFKDISLDLWRVNREYDLKFMGFVPDFIFEPKLIPFVDKKDYPKSLSGAFSIGLAPLKHTEFNLAKSPIKFFEYTMAGIATIAEDFGPYQCIESGYNGLLVDKTWQETIEWAMSNPEAMEDMLKNAQETVRTKHSIQNHAVNWIKAFESVYAAVG